jgi:hypothetical protein
LDTLRFNRIEIDVKNNFDYYLNFIEELEFYKIKIKMKNGQFIDSKILYSQQQMKLLNEWTYNRNINWKLVYRFSTDKNKNLEEILKNENPNLLFIAKNSSMIFGAGSST